jgi:hypothetical protein
MNNERHDGVHIATFGQLLGDFWATFTLKTYKNDASTQAKFSFNSV